MTSLKKNIVFTGFRKLKKTQIGHQNTTQKKIKKCLKRNIRGPLNIRLLVYVLVERLKRKDAPKKLYQRATVDKPVISKKEIYVTRKIVKSTNGEFCLLDIKKHSKSN